jgi:hypothetical protein
MVSSCLALAALLFLSTIMRRVFFFRQVFCRRLAARSRHGAAADHAVMLKRDALWGWSGS